MEETNMDWFLLILIVGCAAGFSYSACHNDETTIELSDFEAEEYRKRLIEREEKDVELDKED